MKKRIFDLRYLMFGLAPFVTPFRFLLLGFPSSCNANRIQEPVSRQAGPPNIKYQTSKIAGSAGLDSLLPIPRASAKMHHCKDFDRPLSHSINDAIGKSRYTILPTFLVDEPIERGVQTDAGNGTIHGIKKTHTESRLLDLVISSRGKQLLTGFWMKTKVCHGLSRLRASRSTCSPGMSSWIPASIWSHRCRISSRHSGLTSKASSKSRLSRSFSASRARTSRGRLSASKISFWASGLTVYILTVRSHSIKEYREKSTGSTVNRIFDIRCLIFGLAQISTPTRLLRLNNPSSSKTHRNQELIC